MQVSVNFTSRQFIAEEGKSILILFLEYLAKIDHDFLCELLARTIQQLNCIMPSPAQQDTVQEVSVEC
jgi:hypothetical protein